MAEPASNAFGTPQAYDLMEHGDLMRLAITRSRGLAKFCAAKSAFTHGDRVKAMMQLSRRPGFDLATLSHSINGRPAVNCARPGPFGNPWSLQIAKTELEVFLGVPTERLEDNRDYVVSRFRAAMNGQIDWRRTLVGKMQIDEIKKRLPELRGHNLACWCGLDQNCHVEVYFECLSATEPSRMAV